MKLPIFLILLAALGHASNQTKILNAKTAVSKKETTSKRELLEGNFGAKRDVRDNYGSPGSSPGIEYAEDVKEALSEQSSDHKIFGARIPQISKISDVLTGQGQPPFEVAVTNHLYAPVSAYQARLGSPTSFEIPAPAASQQAYHQPKQSKQRKVTDNQNLQGLTSNKQQPRIDDSVFALEKPKFRVDNYPRPFSSAYPQQKSGPQDVLRQQPQWLRSVSALFPLYHELRPNGYQAHTLPAHYLQQQGVYQLIPMDSGFDYVNQEENRGEKSYLRENRKELKAEIGRSIVHKEAQRPQQAYHAHPNGAVSFASFTHNLPAIAQLEAASQLQQQNEQSQTQKLTLDPRTQFQQQNEQIQTQQISLDPQPQHQQQNEQIQTQQISLDPQPQLQQQNEQIQTQQISLDPQPQLQQQNEQIQTQQISLDPQPQPQQQNEEIQTQQISLDPHPQTQQQNEQIQIQQLSLDPQAQTQQRNEQIQTQELLLDPLMQHHQQISKPFQQQPKHPSVFQQYIKQLQNYNPNFPSEMRFEIQPNAQSEPQFITLQQPTRHQPSILNPLQQQLLYSNLRAPFQGVQFQRLPAIKPLHTSLQQSTTVSPLINNLFPQIQILPQQFGYHDIHLSTHNPNHIHQPLEPVLQQRHFTPPPLNSNSAFGRSLNPYSRTIPPLLPDPLKSLSSSTPKLQPVPDQDIASSTVQPTLVDQQKPKEQRIHTARQIQTQKYQRLEPQITHQSLPTVVSPSIQFISHQPFAPFQVQNNHLEHSTPQSQYQATIRPPLTQTSPRHEVIIQKQEIQELILDPSPQPLSALNDNPQQQRQQHEQEVYQLQSQQNPLELEQLQPQQYQLEHETQTQQQQFEAQQLQYPEIQVVAQQQYHNQPLLVLQQLQYKPEQPQTQQQIKNPEQKQEIPPQQYQQQSSNTQAKQRQQQVETIEQPEQQQSQETQSQEQQHGTQETEPQQYQQQSLAIQKQLQVSSPKPRDAEKETEYLSELETQTQLENESELQSTTELSEQTDNVPTTLAPQTESDTREGVTDLDVTPDQQMYAAAPFMFAQPKSLLMRPELSSTASGPMSSDMQYFGEFAPSIFGDIRH